MSASTEGTLDRWNPGLQFLSEIVEVDTHGSTAKSPVAEQGRVVRVYSNHKRKKEKR